MASESLSRLDPAVCERARMARDSRFDGRFFIGVRTTGIFCRPICPVRSPKEANVRYFPSAAAAAEAGFRPCLRCRPEAAPGTPAWRGTAATVSRALRLINEGALDGGSVEALAERLGIGPRHLTRLFQRHLGAPPRRVAATRRLLFAKRLLDETDLPLARVAHGAGFGSVRRFNAAIRETYGSPPGALRRSRRRAIGGSGENLVLTLPYRPPLDWAALCRYLAARAIPGVEQVEQDVYRRTLSIDGDATRLEVRPAAGRDCLEVAVERSQSGMLLSLVERARRVFDLDADPAEIAESLAVDPDLARLLRKQPGLRVPGAWDGFELAVRAILGQQVSVKGASTLAGRLVSAFGSGLEEHRADRPSRLFPTPQGLLEVTPEVLASEVGLPRARAETILALARAVAEGRVSLDASSDAVELERSLTALPGIGRWTAQYVALRVLGDPDAFPERDLGLLRSAAAHGLAQSHQELQAHAEAWRPWRAYAALCLWQSDPTGQPKRAARPKTPRRKVEADHVLQPLG